MRLGLGGLFGTTDLIDCVLKGLHMNLSKVMAALQAIMETADKSCEQHAVDVVEPRMSSWPSRAAVWSMATLVTPEAPTRTLAAPAGIAVSLLASATIGLKSGLRAAVWLIRRMMTLRVCLLCVQDNRMSKIGVA